MAFTVLEPVSTKDIIPWVLVSTVLGITILHALTTVIYNIYFHPLSKYPGSRLAAATSLAHWAAAFRGDAVFWVARAHARHPAAPAVRIGPNKLSFVDARAWRDVYGAAPQTAAGKTNPKDRMHYTEEKYGIVGIRDDARHARVRRVFAPAFADRALRGQEEMVGGCAAGLAEAVRREAGEGEGGGDASAVDLCKLYACATFDVMGELAFGEPLGMLEAGQLSGWAQAVFAWNKVFDLARVTLEYPVLGWLARRCTPRALVEMERVHHAYTADRVDRRLERGNEKPDIWNLVLGAAGKGGVGEGEGGPAGLARGEMYVNAGVFMVAGTETTSTVLSGLTWMLCTNPEKMEKLCEEVRKRFGGKSEEMSADALARLPYLNACLEEAMRLYPPLPDGPQREVCEGGNVICGEWVPERTRLTVAQYTAYRSPLYFKDPDSFIPERWLPGTGHDDERREILQPFSYGPRNCMGKNLAYYEMRIFLAKVLLNFDLRLCPQSADWMKQKIYTLWEKRPLWIKATSVQ